MFLLVRGLRFIAFAKEFVAGRGLTLSAEVPILAGVKTLAIQVPDSVFQWLDLAARQRQKTPEEAAVEALATAAHSAEPAPAA